MNVRRVRAKTVQLVSTHRKVSTVNARKDLRELCAMKVEII